MYKSHRGTGTRRQNHHPPAINAESRAPIPMPPRECVEGRVVCLCSLGSCPCQAPSPPSSSTLRLQFVAGLQLRRITHPGGGGWSLGVWKVVSAAC